jgi:probable rRNA maturation factor
LFFQPQRFVDLVVIVERKVAGLSEKALSRFVVRARRAVGLPGVVNVLITSSAAMRSLNTRFRGKNQATDVLSFPAAPQADSNLKRWALTGEIAISADIARANAARLGHSVADEAKVLTLHGILHLAGLDHERDNGQMARKEVSLRRVLRLPAALTERDHSNLLESGARRPGRARSRTR